jgi:hypothetical protein
MMKPIYLPSRRRQFLLAAAEFFTLIAFWGAILAWAILFKALVG